MGSYQWVFSVSCLIWVIIIVTLPITPLITTYEPPTTGCSRVKLAKQLQLFINVWNVRTFDAAVLLASEIEHLGSPVAPFCPLNY